MNGKGRLHKLFLGLGGLAALALSTGPAFAEHGGGGHFGGGAHFGGGEHFAGAGHFAGGGHFVGARPAFRAVGWHGHYGWYGPAWGGLALGLSFAALPLYYDTYWWGGVPYYYADGTYYTWEPSASQYVTVAPPAGLQTQVADQAPADAVAAQPAAAGNQAQPSLMAYPEKGQSLEQQAADKTACQQWASQQAPASNQPDFARAESACLTGRGYSVE